MEEITQKEIQELQDAVYVAIKQTSLLMVMAMSVPEKNVGGMSIMDILENNLVLKSAIDTTEKLKKLCKEN